MDKPPHPVIRSLADGRIVRPPPRHRLTVNGTSFVQPLADRDGHFRSSSNAAHPLNNKTWFRSSRYAGLSGRPRATAVELRFQWRPLRKRRGLTNSLLIGINQIPDDRLFDEKPFS